MKSALARGLYSAASYTLTPFAVSRLLIKSRKNADYRKHIGERFGYGKNISEAGRISRGQRHLHFHAVSVGETLAAAPIIKELCSHHPHWSFSVSVTTPTGRDQAEKHLSDIADIRFLPFDLPDAMTRFLGKIQPDLLVIVETELWPNLIAACHRLNIPTLLMNGRMSEKSALGYKKMPAVTEPMLAKIDLVLAQFDADARRFTELGCSPERVIGVGNLKFDMQLSDTERHLVERYRAVWNLNARPVWIAASTHPGEESLLLAQHQVLLRSFPELLLVLAPRHPDRAQEVQTITANHGLSCLRRTQAVDLDSPDPASVQSLDCQVFILDTLGELSLFYGLADIAFVGGSLVEHGGHNPIEPALWELPILTGLHCHNFSEITRQLAESGALVQCDDAHQLGANLAELIADQKLRNSIGEKSKPVINANQGSLARQRKQIENLLG